MHRYFPEESIYRVDHWLGLDPVESLMFARFANSIIEPILNRNYVQSIEITMAEAFDVADRGSFYDKTGAIAGHKLEGQYRPPVSGHSCGCRVGGSRPPRSYAGAARIRPSVCGVRPRR